MTLEQDTSQIKELVLVARPIIFQFEELIKITKKFSVRLGSGASGSVFRGELDDGSVVAVKMIEGGRNARHFFKAEIQSIEGIHHKHLVPLRGYCSHKLESGGDAFLVYDFFPNGSLNTWIFPHTDHPSDRLLSWKQRYQVALDVAKALAFIHNCNKHILHLDVKPENILLNESYQAVLCDFGLAKLTDNAVVGVQTETKRGTYGYKAPEVLMSDLVTLKCDMYSFGKVLLDLFFGMPQVCLGENGVDIYESTNNSMREQLTFHAFMLEKLEQNDLMQFLDERLATRDVPVMEVNCLVHVALSCLKEDPIERPHSMHEVLRQLKDTEKRYDEPCHKLVVKVHGAYNLKTRPGEDDRPHLYAAIIFEEELLGTRQVKKTRDPRWEEVFIFPMDVVPTGKKISVLVADGTTGKFNLIGDCDIDLTKVIERRHIDQRFRMEGEGKPEMHMELQLRYGSGVPSQWAEGLFMVLIYGVRNIDWEEAKKINVGIVFKKEMIFSGGLEEITNLEWEKKFTFLIDEVTVNEKMDVYLFSEVSKMNIGYVKDISIKKFAQRRSTNHWYQLHGNASKPTPEINIGTKWIRR